MTLDTAVGPAAVFHRLAIGVECISALGDRPVLTNVRAGRQALARDLPKPLDPGWPCDDLERAGPARFKLRHQRGVGDPTIVRIDDPDRRYVPRRFQLHPWPASRVDEANGLPYVPVGSRLLRAWLWPGSAYFSPRGATAIRGRVTTGGRPTRWARLWAIGPTNEIAGRAHADDRGEFVLVVTNPGQNPVQNTIPLDLFVAAPKTPGPVDPLDRCADLVVENIPRSNRPPVAANLDNPVLRGIDVPATYALSVHNPLPLTATVGAELTLTGDVVFDPQP